MTGIHIDEAELKQRISLLQPDKFGFLPIYKDGYMKTMADCTWECPRCGNDFERRPNSLFNQQCFVCLSCSYELNGKARRANQEQADAIDRSFGAIPLGEFVNTKTDRLYECPRCPGNTFMRLPNYIRNGKIYCTECTWDRYYEQQEPEINKRDKQRGAIPIGPFKGEHVPREYACSQCGDKFNRSPQNINNDDSYPYCMSCIYLVIQQKRRLDDTEIHARLANRELSWIGGDYVNTSSTLLVKCNKCGREYEATANSHLFSQTIGCGYCDILKVGEKYHSITITKVEIASTGKNGCTTWGVCDCGNPVGPLGGGVITSGNTKSCGFCKVPKIGYKQNSLTVIDINGAKIKCLCDCGKKTGWFIASKLTKSNKSTCGNCKMRRNGRPTSVVALNLQKITDEILGVKGEHNYDLPYSGNIDIVYPSLKIAIEYCGYYVHRIQKDKTEFDLAKYKKIVQDDGYKLLVINGGGHANDLPTKAAIKKVLTNDFEHGSRKKTINHSSWKKEQEKFKDYQQRKQAGEIEDIRWTKQDDEWLIKHYLKGDDFESMANKLGRGVDTTQTRISTLRTKYGYNIPFRNRWTQDEIEYMKENFDLGPTKISKHLNKNASAVAAMMKKYRPSNYQPQNSGGKKWTPEEKQYIIDHPPVKRGDIIKIAQHLDRTPSSVTQYIKRQK